MSDLEALLAGIVADASNEVRWLVLADWLRDHEQSERADLVEYHRELLRIATEPEAHAEQQRLHTRMMELLVAGVQPCVPQKTILLPGGVEMKFSFIPPGSFQRGNINRLSNEKPVYEVRMTKGYWMGVTPVTQAQWQAIMGNNPSHFNGPQLPVEQVSWDDAVQFCQSVQKKCGIELRLPTEAEWEYACRAGTTTDYNSGNGDDALRQVGWFNGNSGQSTRPVGLLKANAWILHDMHGNVWEWCSDWYGSNYYAESPKDDPQGASSGSDRVYRGGGWYDIAGNCRAAFRHWFIPVYRSSNLGFRVSAGPSELK